MVADKRSDRPPWTPPPWLRRLDVVAEELRAAHDLALTPAQRLDLALHLSEFALARLREQADRRGCTLSRLLIMYEQASDRLRARA